MNTIFCLHEFLFLSAPSYMKCKVLVILKKGRCKVPYYTDVLMEEFD